MSTPSQLLIKKMLGILRHSSIHVSSPHGALVAQQCLVSAEPGRLPDPQAPTTWNGAKAAHSNVAHPQIGAQDGNLVQRWVFECV